MKSESNSDSEDVDDGQLIIVTSSNVASQIQSEAQSDDINNLYSDGIIENLWRAKAMGNYGPEEILVSLWFYISHYFGISSRTDHAKLCLGNIIVDKEGSPKKMLFNRNFNAHNNSKSVFNTRFNPKVIYETPNTKDKCPLTIFETYLSHRPSNFCYPAAPLYLQPDKSFSQDYDGPWYAAAGLGKNRIGALFNAALSKSGHPTIRHYNSRRQIIGEVTKSSNTPSVPKTVDNSPKIKLRICHLSSGNPIVTQSLLGDEVVGHTKRTKTKSACRKRSAECADIKTDLKNNLEPVQVKKELANEPEGGAIGNTAEKFDFSSKKFAVKPSKRIWSLQKSIVNITSRESNPIARQIMMHLSMSKDSLHTGDCKGSNTNNTSNANNSSSNNNSNSNNNSSSNKRTDANMSLPKSRLLRSNVKLHQLHLPLWPSIDKFCDSELQRSMTYSFDDDHGSLVENGA